MAFYLFIHIAWLFLCLSTLHGCLFVYPHCMAFSWFIHTAGLYLCLSTLHDFLVAYPHCTTFSLLIHIAWLSRCLSTLHGFLLAHPDCMLCSLCSPAPLWPEMTMCCRSETRHSNPRLTNCPSIITNYNSSTLPTFLPSSLCSSTLLVTVSIPFP